VSELGATLAARRTTNGIIVPYLCAGARDGWEDDLLAVAEAGADAIEVGIPFSDPSMDGPTIQRASEAALARGTTVAGVLAALRRLKLGVPLVVMTYYNLLFHHGLARSAGELVDAGVSGVIIPDLPIEEAGPWWEAAHAVGLETVQLVSPATPPTRAERILQLAEGFVYAVGLMGVTGEREQLAASATAIASRLAGRSPLAVLVGIGVSSAEHASAVVRAGADGAVVGSAIVRRVLDGAMPEAIGAFVRELRHAVDAAKGVAPRVG
jgi:tryptophan synthase alpha chain